MKKQIFLPPEHLLQTKTFEEIIFNLVVYLFLESNTKNSRSS